MWRPPPFWPCWRVCGGRSGFTRLRHWPAMFDEAWVSDALARFTAIVTLDNHYVALGQGVMVAAALARTGVHAEVRSIGLADVPACGSNAEVLAHHGLDAASIAQAVRACIPNRSFTG